MVAYTRPQQRKKEESEQLKRRERDVSVELDIGGSMVGAWSG